jgi:hypothetical protein
MDRNKLLESARESQRIAEWAVLVGIAFVLIALLFGAFQVYRNGFKITKTRTLTGVPAKILAVVLAILALAVGAYGFLIWTGLPR